MSALTEATSPICWEAPATARSVPIADFLPGLRQAVAAAPERADLKLHLAKALFHTDGMAEIVSRFGLAAADNGAAAEFLYYVGRAALLTGEYRLACTALERAAAQEFGRAFTYLAAALARLDRADEALQAALQGLRHSASVFDTLPVVARTLLDRGEAERLWVLCVELRERGAWGGWLPAVMASTAATLGREGELARLVDRSRWFSATELAVPGNFNQQLAAELLAHKSMSALPPTKATRGAGGRINQLQLAGGPLAKDLLARVRAAAEGYVRERQVFSEDPLIAQRPARVALNSWALTIRDDGHEAWHIHPFGWISGVYYVAVPQSQSGREARSGVIEFGLFPFSRSQRLPSPRWRVTPETGALLLFPSYYAHRTWPTGVTDPRVCVAFDIRPSEAPPDGPQ